MVDSFCAGVSHFSPVPIHFISDRAEVLALSAMKVGWSQLGVCLRSRRTKVYRRGRARDVDLEPPAPKKLCAVIVGVAILLYSGVEAFFAVQCARASELALW